MITVVTSISPKHVNNDIQAHAVNSWLDLGMEVYSMNSAEEIKAISATYPNVKFIPTRRTAEGLYGKPYVMINAVIDWFIETGKSNLCIINSDIELKTDKETIARIEAEMENKILLSNRVNYDNDYHGAQYVAGIDTFFINRKFLGVYNQSVYCFGQCFWDYWIPYRAIQGGVEVVFIKQDLSYHKNHAAQYNADMWRKAGRYFLWENNLYQFSDTNGISNMSRHVYNYIYSATKRIEI